MGWGEGKDSFLIVVVRRLKVGGIIAASLQVLLALGTFAIGT